jgi:hypothetical protein
VVSNAGILGTSLVERTTVILVFVLSTKTCGTVVENCCDINRKKYDCEHFFPLHLDCIKGLALCGACLFVCFLGVTTHCRCIFHSPVAGFSLLVFEVS